MTTTDKGGENRLVLIAVGLIITAVLGGAAALGAFRTRARDADRLANLVRSPVGVAGDQRVRLGLDLPVPAFELEDARGGTLSREDLLGHVWVVDFIFTTCPGICVDMALAMRQLQTDLNDLPDLRFVSISVDPEADTAEALREYAAKNGAGSRWSFLRGDPEEIRKLAAHGFLLAKPSDPKVHSGKFALVDERGVIRGLYDGAGSDRTLDMKHLAEDIRKLTAAGQ